MQPSDRWSQFLIRGGYIAMLVGALDPLEGSLAILPGSALLTLGSFWNKAERPHLTFRALNCGLIAGGVTALFALSALGGIGGNSGRSAWWGLLLLPYLAGWLLTIAGPGPRRWVPLGGIAVGLWYVAIPVSVLLRPAPARPAVTHALLALAAVGVATALTCLWRVRRPAPV